MIFLRGEADIFQEVRFSQQIKIIPRELSLLSEPSYKCDHISEVLVSLHWLRIEQRIIYKILILTFKAFVDHTAPMLLFFFWYYVK